MSKHNCKAGRKHTGVYCVSCLLSSLICCLYFTKCYSLGVLSLVTCSSPWSLLPTDWYCHVPDRPPVLHTRGNTLTPHNTTTTSSSPLDTLLTTQERRGGQEKPEREKGEIRDKERREAWRRSAGVGWSQHSPCHVMQAPVVMFLVGGGSGEAERVEKVEEKEEGEEEEEERDEKRKGSCVRLAWLCLVAPACSGPHQINNLLCWLSLSRRSPRISTTKKVSGNQLSDSPARPRDTKLIYLNKSLALDGPDLVDSVEEKVKTHPPFSPLELQLFPQVDAAVILRSWSSTPP